MRYEMKMPDIATNEPEIRILKWLVKPEDRVKRGQSIVEVETDKATMEVESAAEGTIVTLCASADERVPVGQVIAILEVE